MVRRHGPSKATVAAQAALSLDGPALVRLRTWFGAFFALKQAQRDADPQLLEAFRQLSSEARSTVVAYKEPLVGQIAVQVAGGMDGGTRTPLGPSGPGNLPGKAPH